MIFTLQIYTFPIKKLAKINTFSCNHAFYYSYDFASLNLKVTDFCAIFAKKNEMAEMVKYPIGEQDFKSLREMGCLYVDKTMYIDRIVSMGQKYYFLARPRRFGKSLFLSVLQYFFEGRRKLFEGLFIDLTDWEWESIRY